MALVVAMKPVVSGGHLKRQITVRTYSVVEGSMFMPMKKASKECMSVLGLEAKAIEVALTSERCHEEGDGYC